MNILFAKQADGSYKNPGKEYKDFSPLEKIISSQIMEKSGISYYYPDEGKMGIYDRMWNKDGKALDMNLVMGYAGDSVATAVFMNYFDNMTNNIIDGNTSIASVVSGYKDSGYLDRLIGYYSAKNEFYNGSRKLFDKGDLSRMRIFGEFQADSYYPDGQHKGIDFASAKDKDGNKLIDFDTEDINTYAFYSGKVVGEKLNTTNSGYSIILEYGFDFENQFYLTGVQAQYMHLKEESALSVGDKVTPNTKIGIIGNTDGGTGISTGEHLHYQLMGNLGGLNYDDPKWNMNSGRRDYYLNKLGIPSTSNYSRIPNNIQNYYVGEAKYKQNGVWKKSKYYNYYYNTNPIWQRMGLSSY